MKLFNKYMAWFAAAALATGFVTACQDDIDAPQPVSPVASNQPNTTILDFKKEFWSDATNYIWGTEDVQTATPVAIPTRSDGTHYYIHGRVISSDEAGNVFKSLVIQDETAALAISVNSYNLYLKYRMGQDIVIDVTGMYVGKYNGLLQLGYPEWYDNGKCWEASFMAPEFFDRHVELNGLPEIAEVDTLVINSFSELATDPDGLMKWQSQMVRINNVEFVDGGKEAFSEYHENVNRSLTDIDGTSFNVRTSGYSNFWNKTLPEGRGDVVSIMSYYGTSGWQLILNDYEGCMNFGNPTVAPGAESNPWTVDEAILASTGNGSKTGWVTGYIVGAVAPEVTEVTTNDDVEWNSTPTLPGTLVIGQTADTKDISHAMVVELPLGSALRTFGNLVENPGNYGKQIWIRGVMSTVMGTYGVSGNSGANGTWRIEGVDTGVKDLPDGDGSKDHPYNIKQVQSGAASGTAWVTGYIVGSSTGMSASDFTPGAGANASATNIFIAGAPDVTDYTACAPIQLPAGNVRSALNLQANPGNLGKLVRVYGSIEKYFGQTGVKSVTDYSIDGGGSDPNPPTPGTITGSGTETDPYTVADVIIINPTSTTETSYSGVWVGGYIVGWADMSTEYTINANTARFNSAATLATNILVAADASCTDFTKCIGVQLPSGAVRTALNLQANPGNLGKKVLLKGDILKYSGVPGLRNTSDYKLDGGGDDPTPPTPGQVVTSINQNFDAGTALPAGWTEMKILGDKAWYIATYNGNNYASMTGYKGTAPFDSWLMSPGVDMSKVSDKKLSFETQVNGYGSTTSVFEVYVLDNADPSKATLKAKLNPALPKAPDSGYSSWVASGDLDLSAYTGTVYIGFRYSATTDANYATWCVDNVKLNPDGQGGGDDPTPPTPAGDYKGDFNSFNGGTPKSSPYGTYTNATGWTAENSIVLAGTDDANATNPYFTFIGPAGTMAPTLNGKTTAVGRLTSPVLTGGCGTLTFSYGFAFSETKASFKVTVKDASGNVAKEDTVTLDTINQKTAYSYSLDVNLQGDFTVTIENLSLSASTSNKDRVSIWNLTWTTPN